MCADRHAPPASRAAQRGGSIVEILVGIVIALLVGLVATGSALTFMHSQRQQMGVGGTSTALITTMTQMKNDLSMAGLGFYNNGQYACQRLQASQLNTDDSGATSTAVLTDGTAFVPVWITRGDNYDRIDVVYGTRVEAGAPVRLAATSTGATASLESYLPVAVGDAVVIAPETPGSTAPPCLLRSVTANTPSTSTSAQVLTFGTTGIYNTGSFTGGSNLPNGSTVALLGRVAWQAYRVNDQQELVYEEPLTGRSAVLARNVRGFRAQYGVADAPTGGGAPTATVTNWVAPTGDFAAPLAVASLARVRGLRAELLVRDATKDKPPANSTVCDTTVSKPLLLDATTAENLSNDDWNCWRYRQMQIVVPLRNPVLGLGLGGMPAAAAASAP